VNSRAIATDPRARCGLQWLLDKPCMASVVIGMKSVKQLEQLLPERKKAHASKQDQV
jgi:aryl-alcohol dehydrogenase-like predicted oxidoreductase